MYCLVLCSTLAVPDLFIRKWPCRLLGSLAALPNRLEEDNRDGRGEIQATRAMHRDGQQIVRMIAQQRFGEAFCFPAKDEEIAR